MLRHPSYHVSMALRALGESTSEQYQERPKPDPLRIPPKRAAS